MERWFDALTVRSVPSAAVTSTASLSYETFEDGWGDPAMSIPDERGDRGLVPGSPSDQRSSSHDRQATHRRKPMAWLMASMCSFVAALPVSIVVTSG